MPTIKLTDQFGLDIDAQLAGGSALLKYFQQLPALRFETLDFKKAGGLTLDDPAIRSLSTGVSFQEPVQIGDGGPTLTVAAGTHASFRLVSGTDDLPGQEGEADKQKDACYVAFGLDATVSATVAATAGGIKFGAAPSTRLQLESYSRFPLKAGVTLLDALEQTVTGLSIPAHCTDMAGLAAGQIARVAVTGKLQLSGSADLLATTNPLASASLPAPLPAVAVSAGGSVSVGVTVEIEADYEIVARKLDSGSVRIGWYRKDGTGVTVSVKASEGISAGFGSTDIFSQIVAAISSDPKVDLQELTAAGVPQEQAEAIRAAVKAAVSRKLQVAVSAEFSANDSKSAAFLYEVDPAALTDESQTAIDQALRGDLSALHGAELPGISCVRSIWEHVRKQAVELDVNLLGILNYRSIASLTLDGKVMFEPATGALVITDRATAERIQSTSVNFGADTQKLRHVLAESFLITAAYRGTKQLVGTAALRSSHSFFDLDHATTRAEMACKLRIGAALGLLSDAEAELPAGAGDFGRTLCAVSTDYNEDLMNRMFLDANGAPLGHGIYETAGRAAIQLLVQEGDQDAVRRRPATDDGLWRRMKDTGQPGFAQLFPGVPAPFVGAIVADYSAIQWWSDAMQETAEKLAAMRQWTTSHPGAAPGNPDFDKLRQDLAGHLREVAATTREEFGQPWGLIAMNQLVGRRSGARILIGGSTLVRNKQRALAAVTGP